MFSLIPGPAAALVRDPGGAPLHQQYDYLRLYLGRFLADVRVDAQGAAQWLIPHGQAAAENPHPEPQRISRELAALQTALQNAQGELQAADAGNPGRSALRRTMAAVLGECRLPNSAQDICFNRYGDLLLLNWCVEQPGRSQPLRAVEPRKVIEQLARQLNVDPPPERAASVAAEPPTPVRAPAAAAPLASLSREPVQRAASLRMRNVILVAAGIVVAAVGGMILGRCTARSDSQQSDTPHLDQPQTVVAPAEPTPAEAAPVSLSELLIAARSAAAPRVEIVHDFGVAGRHGRWRTLLPLRGSELAGLGLRFERWDGGHPPSHGNPQWFLVYQADLNESVPYAATAGLSFAEESYRDISVEFLEPSY